MLCTGAHKNPSVLTRLVVGHKQAISISFHSLQNMTEDQQLKAALEASMKVKFNLICRCSPRFR